MKILFCLCRTFWLLHALNATASDSLSPLPRLYMQGHARLFTDGVQSSLSNPAIRTGSGSPGFSITSGNVYGVRDIYNLRLCALLPAGNAALSAAHSETGNPAYRTGSTIIQASLRAGTVGVSAGAARHYLKVRSHQANIWYDLQFSTHAVLSKRIQTSLLAEQITLRNTGSKPQSFRLGWGICYFPEKQVSVIAEIYGESEFRPQLKTMVSYRPSSKLLLSLGAQNRFSEFAFCLLRKYRKSEFGCMAAMHPVLGISSSVSFNMFFR